MITRSRGRDDSFAFSLPRMSAVPRFTSLTTTALKAGFLRSSVARNGMGSFFFGGQGRYGSNANDPFTLSGKGIGAAIDKLVIGPRGVVGIGGRGSTASAMAAGCESLDASAITPPSSAETV